jgi:phage repressor protein C with HTH and peptisase S24 domain
VPSAAVGQGTPVYDIDVTAGSMPRSLMFTDDQIVGWIDLPGMDKNCRIVKVSGDSMKPVICNGDYVAIRELTSLQHIFWGQIYVVLLDDYRLIKYVRRNDDPQLVTLRSANKDYDDMDIPRRDIRDMMLVQQILHLDTRL